MTLFPALALWLVCYCYTWDDNCSECCRNLLLSIYCMTLVYENRTQQMGCEAQVYGLLTMATVLQYSLSVTSTITHYVW